jgi:hypothetical protein
MRQVVEELQATITGLRQQLTRALTEKDQVHCKLHAVQLEQDKAHEVIQRLEVKLRDEQIARKEAQSLFRVEVLNHSFSKRDSSSPSTDTNNVSG